MRRPHILTNFNKKVRGSDRRPPDQKARCAAPTDPLGHPLARPSAPITRGFRLPSSSAGGLQQDCRPSARISPNRPQEKVWRRRFRRLTVRLAVSCSTWLHIDLVVPYNGDAPTTPILHRLAEHSVDCCQLRHCVCSWNCPAIALARPFGPCSRSCFADYTDQIL